MYRGRSCLLLIPMLLVAAASVSAQPASGSMTLDRFLDRQTGRIMAADTDGDGRVSRAEWDALATKGGRDPARRFDAMDADHDGYLDKAEVQAALARRFRRMDRNGDGVVTPDERMAGRPGRGLGTPASMPAPPQP